MQQTNTKEITIDEIRDCFWSRIESILAEKGCKTRREQAEMLGVAVNTRDNWKNKLNSPDYYTLVRIAHKLNVSIDYLIDPSVSIRTPDASIRAASITTGLSEDTIDGLVLMKKYFPSGTAALNALLIYSMGKRENKVEAIGGFLTTLSRYFETTLESDKITDGWVSNEADKNQKLARLDLWVFMSNLLEFGHGGDKMLRLYTDKLNELTKKGCSDNGNRKTDNH